MYRNLGQKMDHKIKKKALSRGECSAIKNINFRTSLLRSNLCNYSDAYIL